MKIDKSAMQELGKKMREITRQKGVTHRFIGRSLNYAPPTISYWFDGKRGVPEKALIAFCNLLGLSSEEQNELLAIGGHVPNRSAPHKQAEDSRDMEQLEGGIKGVLSNYREGDLDFVAVMQRGRLEYEVHLDFENRMRDLGVEDVEQQIEDYLAAGREMGALIKGLDKKFKSLEQGRLIRVVFDVEHGALYFYYISASEYVFGVTSYQISVESADHETYALAKAVRRYLHLEK